MKFKLFIPAIVWFIISTILLALPGNDLPHSRFFDFPYFDKLVHFTMFFLLCTLFCFPFFYKVEEMAKIKKWFVSIALYVLVYGIIMEFVQKYFVPGRSFDVTDILADGLGSMVGLISCNWLLVKKDRPR